MDLLGYAQLSNASYDAAPDIGVECSSAKAIIGATDDGVCIGFPGTENVCGVLTDLGALVHQTPVGGVHLGIYSALSSIWRGVTESAPAVLYGHSLGGALALLAAGMLCLDDKPPKYVYAFEPPQVSVDDTLSKILVDHNVTVVITRNGDDLVPLLPLDIFGGWRHPAPVTRFGTPILVLPNIEDHKMANVIKSIQEMQKAAIK